MRALTRMIAVTVLAMALWSVGAVSSPNWMPNWAPGAPTANAQGVEMLMVPSPAMGRDIPVAFQGGGPHAVVLLDAFNAAPDVSNWVTAGNAMNTLAGLGISVAAPAGGAWSMYTNWEMDGSKQWETFLADELPNWLAANKGLAPGGHGIVGAAQGGTGALTMATFHPDRYRFAGSLSGFLTPSRTDVNGAITAGMAKYGGVNTQAMWGAAQLGRWKWHDPDVHAQLMVDNNTRLWVFSPSTTTCSDPPAMIDYCGLAQGSNRFFYQHYRAIGGGNAHFDFPTSGNHDWGSWRGQLAAMSGDLVATIR
ncbi:MAG: esterase family protein [Mycobacterium sp.]|nr:esterase family protein [Mycobacterium sp.]